MSEEKSPKRRVSRLLYTYLTDELGHIIETQPTRLGGADDGAYSDIPSRMVKPRRPDWVSTPEQTAKWDLYWSNLVGWWDDERMQMRRSKW